jgi:fumarylacetoacetate (FAA) hydrolase
LKLVRTADDPRFYFVVIGEELFPFDIIVPADQRIMMPMQAEEYLPSLCAMITRGDLLARQHTRLSTATPDQFKPFRRPIAEAVFGAPVRPGTVREFAQPRLPNNETTQRPMYQYKNSGSILAVTDGVTMPNLVSKLSFSIQVAAIVGTPGKDITVADGDAFIAGFTILVNWFSPQLLNDEITAGIGPGKSGDFASTMGPFLVTPDSLMAIKTVEEARGYSYTFTVRASLNAGKPSEAVLAINWTFAEMLSFASQGTNVFAGDVLTVPAVPDGFAELVLAENNGFMVKGDRLHLEVEHIGSQDVLIN